MCVCVSMNFFVTERMSGNCVLCVWGGGGVTLNMLKSKTIICISMTTECVWLCLQGKMVQQLAKEPSARLLKHVVRCYLRLSDNPR